MRNLVHDHRTRLGWSQQRLAEELDVSRQTIISIERGRFDPSLPLAFRLAAIFDTTLEELFIPHATTPSQDAKGTSGFSLDSPQ